MISGWPRSAPPSGPVVGAPAWVVLAGVPATASVRAVRGAAMSVGAAVLAGAAASLCAVISPAYSGWPWPVHPPAEASRAPSGAASPGLSEPPSVDAVPAGAVGLPGAVSAPGEAPVAGLALPAVSPAGVPAGAVSCCRSPGVPASVFIPGLLAGPVLAAGGVVGVASPTIVSKADWFAVPLEVSALARSEPERADAPLDAVMAAFGEVKSAPGTIVGMVKLIHSFGTQCVPCRWKMSQASCQREGALRS